MLKIYYKNRSSVDVPKEIVAAMKKVAKKTVEEAYPKHKLEVNITVCDNEEIRIYNRDYRGFDKPTDVLSFPMMDFDTPDITVSIGDIIISAEKATAQAEEYGHSFLREMCFLTAHSCLHLLGYDHEDEDERAEMEAKQNEILNSLDITR